jgi:hypothetical protein
MLRPIALPTPLRLLKALCGCPQPPPLPYPPAALASDPEPLIPGLSPDDVLTLYFTKATNQPDVSSTTKVLSLLVFDPPLATVLSATWHKGGDVAQPSAAERLVIALQGRTSDNAVTSAVGVATVSVLPTGRLTSADGTSQAADIAGVVLGGTWGASSQPQFRSVTPAIALDYGAQPGLGPGDAVLLLFNQPVKPVPVGTRRDLDALLAFDPPGWALEYNASWVQGNTALLVTVVAVGPDAPLSRPLRVFVRPEGGLTSLDGSSPPSTDITTVSSGSFGDTVCDGGLLVFSSTALMVTFRPPVVVGYTPARYNITLQPTSVGAGRTVTRVVATNESLVLGTGPMPSSLGPGSAGSQGPLRFVLRGLTRGASYMASIGPDPPILSEDVKALLPAAVPRVQSPLRGGACRAGSLGRRRLDQDTFPLIAVPQAPVIGTWLCPVCKCV